jgi:RND family efflux transporter MFP subunit
MKQRIRELSWLVLRRLLPLVTGLAGLLLVIAWLSGAFVTKIPPAETAPAVRAYTGQPTEVVHEVVKQQEEEALGTLKASSRTAISAKVLATIEEITVSAGDEVVTGDILARLSAGEFEARLAQAEQSRIAAMAVRREAELAFQRTQKLRRNAPATVTEEQLQRVAAQLETSRADELRAEQAVVEAKVRLADTVISAPKNGKIVDRLAEPGDTAQPGRPLLVLYDAQSLRLEAPVVEELAVRLTLGQSMKVRIDALDREVVGTVDEIVPQAESQSRSLLVKVSLPPAKGLFEGMFGRLIIPAGKRRHLCLPTAAVQQIGQLEFVDVVRAGDGEDQILERRLVKTGRLGMPGRIEVLSGVAVGETVLLHNTPQSDGNAAGSDSQSSPSSSRPGERPE